LIVGNVRIRASTDDQFLQAYHKFADEVGLTAIRKVSESPDDIMNECDPVSRAIMSIPSTTLAGLAVKARLAKYEVSNYWDESDSEVDRDKLTVRKLIDAVIQAASVA
jgi:hypothetical protein